MKDIITKEFPKIVGEIIKEKDIMAFEIKNLPKKISGFTKYDFIFVNSEKDFYTKRFTLCHELGHNVLNHQFGDSREEKEADNFACNILVDDYELKEKVKEGWCLSDLEKLFGVPQREIQKRIYQIFVFRNMYKLYKNYRNPKYKLTILDKIIAFIVVFGIIWLFFSV